MTVTQIRVSGLIALTALLEMKRELKMLWD